VLFGYCDHGREKRGDGFITKVRDVACVDAGFEETAFGDIRFKIQRSKFSNCGFGLGFVDA
jgi:hypothetical protein